MKQIKSGLKSNVAKKNLGTKYLKQTGFLASTITTAAATFVLPAMLCAAPNAESNEKAPSTATKPKQPTADESVTKFYNVGYNYCDAEVLDSYWVEVKNPYDAKVKFGAKILDMGADAVEAIIAPARDAALRLPESEIACSIYDGDYEYEDAEMLAGFWGKKNVNEAKAKMVVMLIKGEDAQIKAALKLAKAEKNNKG